MIGECEMTGRRNVELFAVKIEGTIMNVCKECVKYGERIDKPTSFKTKSFSYKKSQEEQFIVKDYAHLLKQAREKRSLKQSELADQLHIKESLLHKIESGHLKPSIPLAKRLGKFLHITLIETPTQSSTPTMTSSSTSEPLTMEAKLLEAMKKKK